MYMCIYIYTHTHTRNSARFARRFLVPAEGYMLAERTLSPYIYIYIYIYRNSARFTHRFLALH